MVYSTTRHKIVHYLAIFLLLPSPC